MVIQNNAKQKDGTMGSIFQLYCLDLDGSNLKEQSADKFQDAKDNLF